MTIGRNLAIGLLYTVLASTGAGLRAQERLSLTQAVEAVLAANPDVTVGRAATREAEQRVPQARARLLPRWQQRF